MSNNQYSLSYVHYVIFILYLLAQQIVIVLRCETWTLDKHLEATTASQ